MKHYIDPKTKEISAYEEDGSQDTFIKDGLIPISDEELAELKKPTLDESKPQKVNDINLFCSTEITGGFDYNGYRYDSGIEDQINLMGAASMGIDLPFKCKKLSNGVKEFYPHTAAQLKAVVIAGAQFKMRILEKATTLKAKANQAATVKELEAIKW